MIHPTLTLYVPYYRPASEQRWVEIQCCLARNLASGLFRKVYLFADTHLPGHAALSDPRVTVIPMEHRPTYADVFLHCLTPMPGDWSVMANSDIVFDDTLNLLLMTKGETKPPFFCVTRHTFSYKGGWEADPGADGCQDAWAWQGSPDPSLIQASVKADNGKGLRFGVWGSENRLAYEAHAAGYTVFNPGLAVVAKHYHFADERPLGGRHYQIRGKYMFPIPQKMDGPVMARVGYCHGPGGLEKLTMEELAGRPDVCDCDRCADTPKGYATTVFHKLPLEGA